jgi:hypothetical protein
MIISHKLFLWVANFITAHITVAHKPFILMFQEVAWPTSLLWECIISFTGYIISLNDIKTDVFLWHLTTYTSDRKLPTLLAPTPFNRITVSV